MDTLRALAIINMVFYHLIWDLVYLCDFDWAWFDSIGAHIWQQCICYTFILLSGFCFSMSGHKLRRALFTFGGGMLITLVTLLLMPGASVVFGILTCLGTCSLLTIPAERFLRKLHPVFGLSLSLILFFFTRNFRYGYLGFEGFNICTMPVWLYRNTLTAFFGFPHKAFHSTDYFPLFPWLFLFLAGFFLFDITRRKDLFRMLDSKTLPVLTFLSKHSLLIYLLHQPVLYFLCKLIFG